ncbi:YqhG family protein [Brevibacillus thermoruber]|jgi:hypothetical protein|uniref:YqhG family protein n=1 Tax=Brevibacillus thermoruber TaxID=33942 RepID=UPI0004241044|nr:YqhG family protein [Brevibacillus thermoruber]
MQQEQIRQFTERYLAAFSAHIVETHPDYLTVKLPVEVDKDIGNRPFYWSWVEKMNLPYQPLVLTFCFDRERMPEGLRAEHLHLGAGRLQQIFQSARKHGSFVCMYEQAASPRPGARRTTPLVPWLGLNWKVSFICDKKRDMLLHFGINLHQPEIVSNFYPFLLQLSLTPSIPDYCYTLERRLSLAEAAAIAEQETRRLLAAEDGRWAEEARQRLDEELQILEGYYAELAAREPDSRERDGGEADGDEPGAGGGESGGSEPDAVSPPGGLATTLENAARMSESVPASPVPIAPRSAQPAPEPSAAGEEHRRGGGRILDFLRANGIPETPREEIVQEEWRSSTPEEEKRRRMEELRWQYEPRIEVQFLNGGLFYLQSTPPAKNRRNL